MIRNAHLISLLLMLNCANLYPQKPYYSDDSDIAGSVAMGAACVAGVAAVGYGLYKAVSWAFSESDQQLLKRAADTLRDAKGYHDRYLCPFSNRLQQMQLDTSSAELYYTLEPLLHEHALHNHADDLASFPYIVDKKLKLLEDLEDGLQQRVRALCPRRQGRLASEFDAVIMQVQTQIKRYHGVKKYLSPHSHYFNLFREYSAAVDTYGNALNVAQMTSFNRDSINGIILASAVQAGRNFPYVSYVRDLDARLAGLKSALASSFVYPQLAGQTQELCIQLAKMKEIIVTQHAYFADQQAHHLFTLEQERARMERERLEQMRQQTLRLAEQNRIQAERNRLLQEQNFLSMLPKTHVHVAAQPVYYWN